jgi:hypothetical protein
MKVMKLILLLFSFFLSAFTLNNDDDGNLSATAPKESIDDMLDSISALEAAMDIFVQYESPTGVLDLVSRCGKKLGAAKKMDHGQLEAITYGGLFIRLWENGLFLLRIHL